MLVGQADGKGGNVPLRRSTTVTIVRVVSRCAPLLALAFVPRTAHATDYWVGPPGATNGNGTQTSPFSTIRAGAQAAQAGDTVYIHGGTYSESVSPPKSGTSSAWITYSAAPKELPILDGNGTGGSAFGNGTAQYIRVVGIAARRWNSGGFGNGWVNNTGQSNGNWQFIDCIADNNGINGMAFYNATGLLIDESIVAHNGNQMPSWSSGVNLFHLSGDATTNIVRRTVAFENIDITTSHATPAGATDGSGFILDILDRTGGGALFENNLGFRNGGSCIRINTVGAVLVNNTCYDDGLNPIDSAPAAPGEVFFSSGNLGAVMINNLLVAGGYTSMMAAAPTGNVPTGQNFLDNVTLNSSGALPATPFFSNPIGIDFSLVAASAPAEIDKGSTMNLPSTDIGFDPKCVTTDASKAAPLVGTAVSWWSYYIDYAYIGSVGGIAGCFHPAVRPQGNGPDIGAYEYGGVLSDAGAGGSSSSSSGGSSSGSGGGSSGARGDASAGSSSGTTGSSGGSGAGSNGGSGGGSNGGSGGGSGGGPGGSSGGGSSGASSGADSASTNSSGGGATGSGSGSSSGGNGATPGDDGGDAFVPGSSRGCGCNEANAMAPIAGAGFGLGLIGLFVVRRRRA